MFSIRVKGLFDPIVLHKISDKFSLFLKAFSCDTYLLVTLDLEIWKWNLYLTENRLSRNEIRCAVHCKFEVFTSYKCPAVTFF